MSWLEKLSAASFLRHGHTVRVYSYEPVAGLPEGVEVLDASAILPRESMVFYKGRGTPGVFADRFRLELMARGLGVWADLDVVCLAPLSNMPDYIMGYERPGSINSAVLRIPAGSELLRSLFSVFEEGRRPLFEPHLPPGRRLEVAAKRLMGMRVPPEYMQYGATGPFALTYHSKRLGISDIQPEDVFYPVPYTKAPSLMQAGTELTDFLTDRSLAVHVWRSQLTVRGRRDMPPCGPGSALDVLCREFKIEGARPIANHA